MKFNRWQSPGTNLFDAVQEEEMVRYMVDGLPARAPRPEVRLTVEQIREVAELIVQKYRRLLSDEFENTQEVMARIIAQEFNAALAAEKVLNDCQAQDEVQGEASSV